MSGFKHQLYAYLGEECIATLALAAENELNFLYHEKWQHSGYALSPHLPLDNSAAKSQFAIKVFFQNLFPEGENFDILLQSFRVSRNNIFAITQILGLDLPGALQIISDPVMLSIQTSFRAIQPFEIVERLKNYSVHDLVIWDGKPRLSVAGIHQKINVVVKEDGELGFGEGQLCSTHILKFDRSPKNRVVINEFLMMQLAKGIGLNVADVELKYFAEYPTLLIKRFDRTWRDHKVLRRHMIDGCQALNLLPDYKYERNFGSGRDVKDIREGASFPALFAFCNACKNPALAKKQLLEWTLFNLIIGNWDAHGKNISFFVSEAGIEIAPLYDLICIRIYPEFSQELAMALGDEFDTIEINAYQLADFADSCQISRVTVATTLINLCHQVLSALPYLLQFPEVANEKDFIKQLSHGVETQVMHFIEQAPLIADITL